METVADGTLFEQALGRVFATGTGYSPIRVWQGTGGPLRRDRANHRRASAVITMSRQNPAARPALAKLADGPRQWVDAFSARCHQPT